MSDDDAARGPSAEILARVAETLAEGASADLTALLGRSAELKPAGVENIDAEQVCTEDDPIVHQLCRASGSFSGELHVVVPRPDACRLSALQQGTEDDDIADESLDAEARAALQVVVKLFVDAFSARLCDEDLQNSIEVRDAREIPEPASDPTWITGEHFQRLRFELALERMPAGRIDLLIDSAGGSADSDAPGTTILFVAGRESEGESLESLSGSLGWPVTFTTLEGLGEAPVKGAGAIVVPWQVGGRAGLELIEHFSSSEDASGAVLVMAAARPTRPMVMAAMRAGADSFATLPYEGEELRTRISNARGQGESAGDRDPEPEDEAAGDD